MKTLNLEGRYVTSNRYAESVFGDYKARETKNTGATQSTLSELTISKMNNTQSFLRAMSKEAVFKLWEEIGGKTALTDFKKARMKLNENLQASSTKRKDALRKLEAEKAARKQAREDKKTAGIKIEAEKKKAGEKRRYQENNSTIPPRKKLPKRKTANKSS